MKTYTETFSTLAHWAAGHRFIHDLVLHPLMALTGYADWTVKLHDFQSFKTSNPKDDGLVGVTGTRAAVERAINKLGGEVREFHEDGLLCYGTIDTGPYKADCSDCGGKGYRVSMRRGGWREPPYEVHTPCGRCRGSGKVNVY